MKSWRENPDSEENQRATRENEAYANGLRLQHIFSRCNVCGRELVRDDEFAIGMCAICANE